MSTYPPTIEIVSPKSPLPQCSPNLMPFHIDYSGPAPISTYFRAKPAPPPAYAPSFQKVDDKTDTRPPTPTGPTPSSSRSESTLADSSTSTAHSQASMATNLSSSTLQDNPYANEEVSARHFIAAFRGRTVRGLKVDMPEGYSGIVLSTPEDGQTTHAAGGTKGKAKAGKASAGKRTTRRSARTETEEAENLMANKEEMDDTTAMDTQADEDADTPRRVLKLASTFSSFVLWNPDIPVDEGKDEYLRSLTEWTKLAAEIHGVEE